MCSWMPIPEHLAGIGSHRDDCLSHEWLYRRSCEAALASIADLWYSALGWSGAPCWMEEAEARRAAVLQNRKRYCGGGILNCYFN